MSTPCHNHWALAQTDSQADNQLEASSIAAQRRGQDSFDTDHVLRDTFTLIYVLIDDANVFRMMSEA